MGELEETEPSSTSATFLTGIQEELPSEELPLDEDDLLPEIDSSTDNDNTPHIYGGPNIIYNPELVYHKPPPKTEDLDELPPHIDRLPAHTDRITPELQYKYPNIKKSETDVRPPVTGSFSPVVPPIPDDPPPEDDNSTDTFIRYFTRKFGQCVLLFQVEGVQTVSSCC